MQLPVVQAKGRFHKGKVIYVLNYRFCLTIGIPVVLLKCLDWQLNDQLLIFASFRGYYKPVNVSLKENIYIFMYLRQLECL